MSLAPRRRRALVLVAVGASQDWTASLLSLPALEHHLVGLGALENVDRQAESKVSSHANVFDSMWAFQPVHFELGSRDCQPSLPLLSLFLSPPPPSSLSLSLSLSLSASLHIVKHTDNCGNLKPCWKTRCEHDRQLLFQNVVSVHVLLVVAFSVAETRHLFSFHCLSVLPCSITCCFSTYTQLHPAYVVCQGWKT